MIKVHNLVKSYGEHTILHGITTQIKEGEVVAIIGPSGGGKSTFCVVSIYLRCQQVGKS